METGWYVAAVAGAFGAAYDMRNFHPTTIRDLWLCLATAGVCGILLMIFAAVMGGLGTTRSRGGSRWA